MKRLSVLIVLATLISLVPLSVAQASTTVVVYPADVGVNWFKNDTRAGGTVSFVVGPSAPPLGTGSLQMTTTDTAGGSAQAKAQLFNYGYVGTPLASITAISYWGYRSSASTNPPAQTISLNIEVDYVGDGSSFTTLVFEPVYNGYQGAMLTNTWQHWNAYDGGNAIWWSTKDIPGVCAFNCFVPWSTCFCQANREPVDDRKGNQFGQWARTVTAEKGAS